MKFCDEDPLTMLPLTVDNMTFFHSEIFTTCQIELFPFCTRVMILYCTYQLHLTCHDTVTQRQVRKRTSQTVGTLKTRIWVHSVWLKGTNSVWEKKQLPTQKETGSTVHISTCYNSTSCLHPPSSPPRVHLHRRLCTRIHPSLLKRRDSRLIACWVSG